MVYFYLHFIFAGVHAKNPTMLLSTEKVSFNLPNDLLEDVEKWLNQFDQCMNISNYDGKSIDIKLYSSPYL